MRKWLFVLGAICFLAGCQTKHFPPIEETQPFVASVNILAPSVSFYDETGQELADWPLEAAYTGATLIDDAYILLYGHELPEVVVYALASGEEVAKLETGAGTTNVYYAEDEARIYIANSKRNEVTSYNLQYEKIASQGVYNYPMSMIAEDGQLYVVHYKDTILSVLHSETLAIEQEWPIEYSSHGLAVVGDELWIGGHGEGEKPNDDIDVYNRQTGMLKKKIAAPLMPISFSQQGDELAIVSHGESTLYEMTASGEVLSEQKIGANPFSASYFHDMIVVAGYDDATLYFVKDGKMKQEIKTGAGPFQLLVRE